LGQLKKLKEKILTKINPKQLKGVNLTPKMYFNMVEKYVEAINNGAVPTINTAWEHLVDTECRDALESAWTLYEEALKKFLFDPEVASEPKQMDDLYHILKNIRDKTLEKYNMLTASFERHPKVQEYKDKLKEYLDQREDKVFTKNEEMAAGSNEELIAALAQSMKDNLARNFYGEANIELFCNDFNEMANAFDVEASGVNKCRTLISFLGTFNRQALQSIGAAIKKNYDLQANKYAGADAKQRLLEEDLKAKINELQQSQRTYEDTLKRVNAEKDRFEQQNRVYQKQISEMNSADKDKAITDLRNKNVNLEKNVDENVKEKEKLQTEIEQLKVDMSKKKACCTIF